MKGVGCREVRPYQKFPNVTTEYVQFVYEMVHGTELSDENTEIMLRNRR